MHEINFFEILKKLYAKNVLQLFFESFKSIDLLYFGTGRENFLKAATILSENSKRYLRKYILGQKLYNNGIFALNHLDGTEPVKIPGDICFFNRSKKRFLTAQC